MYFHFLLSECELRAQRAQLFPLATETNIARMMANRTVSSHQQMDYVVPKQLFAYFDFNYSISSSCRRFRSSDLELFAFVRCIAFARSKFMTSASLPPAAGNFITVSRAVAAAPAAANSSRIQQ